MIIHIKDKNKIDFQAPVYMIKSQQEKFISGMKEIFGDKIVIKEIIENKKEIKGRTGHPIKFSIKNLLLLADAKLDNEAAAKKLGKTEFAIQMKRGPYLKGLLEWAKKKGLTELDEKTINEFLKEGGLA